MSSNSGYYILKAELSKIRDTVNSQTDSWNEQLKTIEDNLTVLSSTSNIRGNGADNIKKFIIDGPLSAAASLKTVICCFQNLITLYVQGYDSIDSDKNAGMHEDTIHRVRDDTVLMKYDFTENRSGVMDTINSISDIFSPPVYLNDLSGEMNLVCRQLMEFDQKIIQYEDSHSHDMDSPDAMLLRLKDFIDSISEIQRFDISAYRKGILSDPVFPAPLKSALVLEKLLDGKLEGEDIKKFGEVAFSELLNLLYGPMILCNLKYGDKVEIPVGPGITLYAGISGNAKGLLPAQLDFAVDKNTGALNLGGGASIDTGNERSFGISGDKNADLNVSFDNNDFEFDLSTSGEGAVVLKKKLDEDTTITITFKTDGKELTFEEKAQTKIAEGKIDTKFGIKLSREDEFQEETVAAPAASEELNPGSSVCMQILADLLSEKVPVFAKITETVNDFIAGIPGFGEGEFLDLSYFVSFGQGTFAFGY